LLTVIRQTYAFSVNDWLKRRKYYEVKVINLETGQKITWKVPVDKDFSSLHLNNEDAVISLCSFKA